MDRVRVRCPHCGASFVISAAAVGKRGKCSRCGSSFVLEPAPSAARTSADSAAAARTSAKTSAAAPQADFSGLLDLDDRGAAVAVAPPPRPSTSPAGAPAAPERAAATPRRARPPRELPGWLVAVNCFVLSLPVKATWLVALIGLGAGTIACIISTILSAGPAKALAACERDLADARAGLAKVEAERAEFRQKVERDLAQRGETVRWPENAFATEVARDAPPHLVKDSRYAVEMNEQLNRVNRELPRNALLERSTATVNPQRTAMLGGGFVVVLLLPFVWAVFRRAVGVE